MTFKQSFLTNLTDVDTTDKEGVGTIRMESNKVYKYVKYTEGAAALNVVAGDFVFYDNLAGLGYQNSVVTPDLSDSDEVPAGVIQATIVDDLRFCWILVQGFATLNTGLIGGADGDPLTPTGADDKTLDVSAAVTDVIAGVAIDATLDKIYVDCPW